MRVDNRANLSSQQLGDVEALAVDWLTLQDVVQWGLTQVPPLIVCEVVVQDEFTHDVVLPYRGGTCLVFDTT
jgi:hypothetical protein